MYEYKINGIAKVIITQKRIFRKGFKRKTIEIPFSEITYAYSEDEAIENSQAHKIFNWSSNIDRTWIGGRFACDRRMFIEGKTYKRIYSMLSTSISWDIVRSTPINNWSVQKCKDWLTPKEFVRHIGREELMK